MSTYIKNQEGGYTLKQLKELLFEKVKEIFEATIRKVQSFVPMDSELEVQRLKRAGQDVIEEPVKRQRTGEASGSVQEQTSEEPKAKELSQEQLHQMMMLYDTCGFHHVSTERRHDIYMLVEKDYPLKKALATLMMCNKLRVDQYSDMADELLQKINIIENRPRQMRKKWAVEGGREKGKREHVSYIHNAGIKRLLDDHGVTVTKVYVTDAK
ncbi:hypothetical protein Tco_1181863 [Tanacetum coccineum]